MDILQINLNKSRTAQDLALNTMRVEKVDVMLLSEIYGVPQNNGNWVVDCDKKVAIVTSGVRYPIQRIRSVRVPGVVVADVNGVTIVNCYVQPHIGVAEFEGILDRIFVLAQGHPRVLLAGDFNAWHNAWGSERTNQKGEALLQLANSLQLEVLNVGTEPTFRGCGVARPSRIDVAFASPSICRPDLATNPATCWRILRSYSYSDHVYIRYTIGELPTTDRRGIPRGQRSASARLAGTRWNTRQFNSQLFESSLRASQFEERGTSAESLVEALTRACDETMSRVFPSQEYTGRPAYWWTPEIANLVEACREADQLRNVSPNHLGVAAEVQQTRNGLKTAIKASKKQFFECMVLAMHNDETGHVCSA